MNTAKSAANKMLQFVLHERVFFEYGPLLTTTLGAASVLLRIANDPTSEPHWYRPSGALELSEYTDSLTGSIGRLQTLLSVSSRDAINPEIEKETLNAALILSEHIASSIVAHTGRVRLYQNDGSVQPIVGVAHGSMGLTQLITIIVQNYSISSLLSQKLQEYAYLILKSELAYTESLPFGVPDFRTNVKLDTKQTWHEVCETYNSLKPMEGWCSGEAGILEEAINAGLTAMHPELLERTLKLARSGAKWANFISRNGHSASLQQLYICHGLTSPLSMLNALVSSMSDETTEGQEAVSLQKQYVADVRRIPAAIVSQLNSDEINLGLFNGFSGYALAANYSSITDMQRRAFGNSSLSNKIAGVCAEVLCSKLDDVFSNTVTKVATSKPHRISTRQDFVDYLFRDDYHSSYLHVLFDRIVRTNHVIDSHVCIAINLVHDGKLLTHEDGTRKFASSSMTSVLPGTAVDAIVMSFDKSTADLEIERYFDER